MQIISNYNDIDVNKIKVGDKFLAIHEDESYSSYEFVEKKDILYKFKVNVPNNALIMKKPSESDYYLEHFFKYDNNLFLIGSSIMKCYDTFVKYPQFHETTNGLCANSFGYGFFGDNFLDFLISEKVFKDDYKIKTNKKVFFESHHYDNNGKKTAFLYSYLSLNINSNIILFINKYDIDHNRIDMIYCIIDLKKHKEQIDNIDFITTSSGHKKNEIEKYMLQIKNYPSYYINNINLFSNMIKNIKNIDIKKFCDLTMLLYKVHRAPTHFDNMENIINKLKKQYDVNVKYPIKPIYLFLGYECYDINGYCMIYNNRNKSIINLRAFNSDDDISYKYLNKDNIIIESLNKYYDYYVKHQTNNLPTLFCDINDKLNKVLYKEQRFFIDDLEVVYEKFGPFYERVKDDTRNLVLNRYETYKKLKEAY